MAKFKQGDRVIYTGKHKEHNKSYMGLLGLITGGDEQSSWVKWDYPYSVYTHPTNHYNDNLMIHALDWDE